MYRLLYSSKCVEVSHFYREHKSIVNNNIQYISKLSRSQRSAVIAARWCGVHGIDDHGKDPIRIGLVRSFIDNVVTLRFPDDSSPGSHQSHVLMHVHWYENHPQIDWIDSSIILTSTVFENHSCA